MLNGVDGRFGGGEKEMQDSCLVSTARYYRHSAISSTPRNGSGLTRQVSGRVQVGSGFGSGLGT